MTRFAELKRRLRSSLRVLAGAESPPGQMVQAAAPTAPPPVALAANAPTAPPPVALAANAILEHYVTACPSPQVALDIFKGEWSSRLPEPLADLQAGAIELFADHRITWMLAQFGAITGQHVLELGPLEGGHTYMLEQAGAAEVIAIEANTRAFLKCLIVKELLDLRRTQFLCGDFIAYLQAAPRRFDLIVASGVLYHMQNPVELLALIAQNTDRVFVWTHYYDEAIIKPSPTLGPKFPARTTTTYAGFTHTLYHQEYQAALAWSGFCGGSAAHSAWMARDELLACVRYFGLSEIQLAFEAPDHPNGPSFAFVASRPAQAE